MDLTAQISFRTAQITADSAAALSHDHDIKYPELIRLAFSHGVKNAKDVAETKRDELTLEQALLLQSCGVDYT